jgi:hypothetical protein
MSPPRPVEEIVAVQARLVKGLCDVRFGLKADMRPLFDHLVGAPDERVGDVEAECLGGLQVDVQLDANADRLSGVACPIFHHLDCYIRANRAFKSTFIVVRLVRLDAGEPHLCLADFAKRATDDPLLRKILILSHTTPRFSVTGA